MTSTPKSAKHAQESESPTPSPLAGPGPGGHKASFKSTKLARRARSFKDDFLGKISQMRSPTNQIIRSNSPKGRITKRSQQQENLINNYDDTSFNNNAKGPIQELNRLQKHVEIGLKHFRDVIIKDKLEMLSGNGTIILDSIWQINLIIKSSIQIETSNIILSALNHMYQSISRLIKLCDDVLMDNKSNELNKENVDEIVQQVDESVKNVIKLVQEKILYLQQNQHNNYKTAPRNNNCNNLDLTTQRNSLPDIPLTPREREILEQTKCGQSKVRNSHSTESILRDSSNTIPPPKPPLPDGIFFNISQSEPNSCTTPPPLPPKKKNYRINQLTDECYSIDNSPNASSLERVSIRSKSPEDSISLLSASAGSLDSILNHSREEDEIKALMDDGDSNLDNHSSDIFGNHNSWEESSLSSNISNQTINDQQISVNDYHRLSNTDSGILSAHSYRSSYSKRSSQQSSTSSQWGSCTTSNNNIVQHQQQQHFSKQTASTTTTTNITELCNKNENLLLDNVQKNILTLENQLGLKNFNQKITSTSNSSSTILSSSSSSTIVNSTSYGKDEVDFVPTNQDLRPPAIPEKTRKKPERQPSPYDNVPDSNLGEMLVTCQMHQSHQNLRSSSVSTFRSEGQDSTKPPPLPPKKKHIMAYMEMFGNCSHTTDQEFMRHSVHMVQAQWLQPSTSPGLPTTQSCSFSHSSHSSSSSRSTHTQINTLNLPSTHSSNDQSRTPSPIISSSNSTTIPTNAVPPALPPKQRTRIKSSSSSPPQHSPTTTTIPSTTLTTTSPSLIIENKSPMKSLPDLLEHTATTTTTTVTKSSPKLINDNSKVDNNETNNDGDGVISSDPCDTDLLEELNAEPWLVFKKTEEDGPDIRGGPIDALIIQATKATKNGVFAYQEAFLTTYRTFITPLELICKLIRRFNHFYYQPDTKSLSYRSFALIVRVASDLTASDFEEEMQYKLMKFVHQLLSFGEVASARALRITHLNRYGAKILNSKFNTNIINSLSLNVRNVTLLDFKSEQIAEQMTLLDAELFMKIEIPEVLIWAQEQNEERSPNLTRFTEHFNKMSYWARTRILTTENKDTREKYFLKFIKIMKHLRKMNNFNSYLALLSALDSAPVRRLEWQKHVQEGLKEYCALIDSSSSFRAYRQALAETQPPCIPYIGLVLQDLTFVHIGNSNLLSDGTINFSKRWQQFNIVENMKKFKQNTYDFKKNEQVIQFFQNFDDFIGEDAMWQLSESIKPRGGKKN